MSYLTTNSLKPLALKLRREFETILEDPHSPDRFQWDWWHLPGRYTHLRTPAARFFSDHANERLISELRAYGREQLGCQDISPIWLSNYIEGCEQRLHADRPHGPWAFVLSLSPAIRKFQGGETIILRSEVLSFWHQGTRRGQAFEESEIVDRIPSVQGRLLVFDPRRPHGVSRLSGTLDPLEGRLVVHGWFAQPQPFVDGPVSAPAAEKSLQAFDDVLASRFSSGIESTGTTAYRIAIRPDGKVSRVTQLASSLAASVPAVEARETKMLTAAVRGHFLDWKFPKAKRASQLTLPLSFER
ncbi:hypothetical protein BH10BDE1_BH10BDE1_20190 [soil metagenome]